MMRKPQHLSALVACALVVLFSAGRVSAQAAPAIPGDFVSPATLIRLFKEADKAFAAKEYVKAVAKIEELLKALGTNKDAPLELLYFNIGLGNLLAEKPAEAEAGFTECLKRFPKGEYASRCYLGVGRACILQGTAEKKARAIDALKLAALDPRFRSEAGLWLGQVYLDLGKRDEAMLVFKSLMGSDIRSPAQTTAAVEVIGLLADGKLEDLILYLDRLINQSGVRDALAWYANQVIVRGDELVGEKKFDAALAIYRSIPPRDQILEVQKLALESQRKDVKTLEARVAAEQDLALNKRSNASELLGIMKPAVALAATALTAVEEKADLDAAILMRRGRCLYNLDRYEEALVCFRALRTKHGSTPDAKSAAYGEIVILNKLKDISQIKVLCDAFLQKYPNDENAEQVATLAGEVLVQSGDWKEVGKFYKNLEAKFPKSPSLDRFTFFQALSFFMDADFKESTPIFARFLKNFPDSELVENGVYYTAMSNFLSNNYKETLKSCKEYLTRFPDGRYAGDMRYRLAFIDFNDKDVDQSDKIIRDLTSFIIEHPNDASVGSMWCLVADTYKKKTAANADELGRFQQSAIDAYKKAVDSDSPDDVIQYALDSATAMLQAQKEWAQIAAMHSEFIKKKPDSALVLTSIGWIIKCLAREGKVDEAADIVANALQSKIGNPASEAVEYLIDELVKTLVPRKKASEVDIDAVDAKLVGILNKAIAGKENATTNARIFYARARLAQALKRNDRADLYLKGIATINAKNPSILSPALLAVSGDILLKLGQLEEAQAMYQRLIDRYPDGMYADAGPVGLGYIALAKKKPADALKIFDEAIERSPGSSRLKETTLGKLEAMIEVGQLKEAEKLASETVGDKAFRGEAAGKANLLLARTYRKQSEQADGVDDKLEFLKKSFAIATRVYIASASSPEVCAEGYWQAYLTAVDLGNKENADKILKEFLANTKLQNTEAFKKAAAIAK
jgi:TolA-binding protein